jgi:hypothetical protein
MDYSPVTGSVLRMKHRFHERTPWPIWLWFFLLFMAASLALAFWAALGNTWGAISGLLEVLGLLYLSQSTLLTIEVDGSTLTVGAAHIDISLIGEVEALDAQEMSQARGPLLDPAAFLSLRFWINTGVKVEIKDPRDPTPYWLVSSKKAQLLRAALSANN